MYCAGNLNTMRTYPWGSNLIGMVGIGQGCCVILTVLPSACHSAEWPVGPQRTLAISLVNVLGMVLKCYKRSTNQTHYYALKKGNKKKSKKFLILSRLKVDWGKIIGRILWRQGRSGWLLYLLFCPLQIHSGKQFQIVYICSAVPE